MSVCMYVCMYVWAAPAHSSYKCHKEESFTLRVPTKWKFLALLHCLSQFVQKKKKKPSGFLLGHCQTFESSVQRKEWQSVKGKWRERGLAKAMVLSADSITALLPTSPLTPAEHSECWPWAQAHLGQGNSAASSAQVPSSGCTLSVCFLSISLPLLFFI